MRKDTKEALQKSIEHWERLARAKKTPADGYELDGEPFNESPEGRDCALCHLFFVGYSGFDNVCMRRHGEEIERCPVFAKTGDELCSGTPYSEARACFYYPETVGARGAIQEEVDFLKSLLPDEEEA